MNSPHLGCSCRILQVVWIVATQSERKEEVSDEVWVAGAARHSLTASPEGLNGSLETEQVERIHHLQQLKIILGEDEGRGRRKREKIIVMYSCVVFMCYHGDGIQHVAIYSGFREGRHILRQTNHIKPFCVFVCVCE